MGKLEVGSTGHGRLQQSNGVTMLPVVTVRGNYHQVGRAIARVMGRQVRSVLERYRHRWRELGVTDAEAMDSVHPYLEASEAAFPELMAELAGIADGAEVSLRELFRAECHEARLEPERAAMRRQMRAALPAEESTVPGPSPNGQATAISAAAAAVETAPVAPSGCTSVVSRRGRGNGSGVVVGHTEDSWPLFLETLYVLRAAVTHHGYTNRICGLNYAHALIGCSAAMNGYGLIHLVDSLQRTPQQEGVPKHVISRAILDQPSIDAAVDLLRRTRRASGWNHLLVQGDRVVNVETTATAVVTEEVDVPAYVHTNHYLASELAAESPAPRSDSVARLNRAQALMRVRMRVREMQRLLGDRDGYPESICRDATLGAFVCDSRRQAVWILWGRPGQDGAAFRRFHLPARGKVVLAA